MMAHYFTETDLFAVKELEKIRECWKGLSFRLTIRRIMTLFKVIAETYFQGKVSYTIMSSTI